MNDRTLGRTDMRVSPLCLGSMTWGSQNSEAEGHALIDQALDGGINFIDTAAMYPANPGPDDPPGRTEEIIGTWLEKTGRREDVLIATKITGEGSARTETGEEATPSIGPETIRASVERSLKRLRTDHIDLYQLHWPNRGSYHFRKYWSFDPTGRDPAAIRQDIAETLGALGREVEAGRIRHVGLSNETAWGVALFLEIAAAENLPRVASIQNEYSLLCRLFDTDLAELCTAERVDLLGYSPLASGLLTGKYAGDATPEGSRRARNATLGGRLTPAVWPAHDAYLALAGEAGIDPAAMALAWCLTRPFMGSVIFGATTPAQLRTALGAASVTLSDDILVEIDRINRRHPMPV